jgi:hypothetical protein
MATGSRRVSLSPPRGEGRGEGWEHRRPFPICPKPPLCSSGRFRHSPFRFARLRGSGVEVASGGRWVLPFGTTTPPPTPHPGPLPVEGRGRRDGGMRSGARSWPRSRLLLLRSSGLARGKQHTRIPACPSRSLSPERGEGRGEGWADPTCPATLPRPQPFSDFVLRPSDVAPAPLPPPPAFAARLRRRHHRLRHHPGWFLHRGHGRGRADHCQRPQALRPRL